MSTKYLRVSIPTKTYLRKFIETYEGPAPVLDNSTLFRQVAFSFLEKSVIRDENYKPKNLAETGHNDKLIMLVSERTFSHVGHSISLEKAMYINNYIKSDFDTKLTYSILLQTITKHKTIRKSAEFFCEAHGIEVDMDISLDNLVKKWHRTLPKVELSQVKNNVTENIVSPIEFSHQIMLFQ